MVNHCYKKQAFTAKSYIYERVIYNKIKDAYIFNKFH